MSWGTFLDVMWHICRLCNESSAFIFSVKKIDLSYLTLRSSFLLHVMNMYVFTINSKNHHSGVAMFVNVVYICDSGIILPQAHQMGTSSSQNDKQLCAREHQHLTEEDGCFLPWHASISLVQPSSFHNSICWLPLVKLLYKMWV